jgi:hypothetical protein
MKALIVGRPPLFYGAIKPNKKQPHQATPIYFAYVQNSQAKDKKKIINGIFTVKVKHSKSLFRLSNG